MSEDKDVEVLAGARPLKPEDFSRPLPPPYELLELDDRQSVSFVPTAWETGYMQIRPRYAGAPQQKTVNALRIYVRPEDKRFFPYWWDITANTLIAQLLPFLAREDSKARVFTITAHGQAPRKRYTLKTKLLPPELRPQAP